MEPTITQPTTNKNPPLRGISRREKKFTIIVLIIIAIIVIILLSSKKVNAPIITEESKQLIAEIDNATTFDNEADLIEIEKEF